MTTSIRKHLTARGRRVEDGGFSFIELLAYMAIAALLILAAIPQFNQYRQKAIYSNMQSDARNIAVAIEAEYTTNLAYPTIANKTAVTSTATSFTVATGNVISISDSATQVYYQATAAGGANDSYKLALRNAKVSGKWVNYDEAAGGLMTNQTSAGFTIPTAP